MTKRIQFLSAILGLTLIQASCEPIPETEKGTLPGGTDTPEIPIRPSYPTGKIVSVYYPSYGRYEAAFTASEMLQKAGPGGDYQMDEMIPSFCVIGDGKTAIGSEAFAWKKNELALDDLWAWGGFVWAGSPDGQNANIVFANGTSLGEGSIFKALNDYPTIPYGIAIGGWPKDDNPNDPLRTGAFDRIGTNPDDLAAFVQSVSNAAEIRRFTRFPNAIHVDYEFPETPYQADALVNICRELYLKVGNTYKIDIALSPNINHLAILDFTELNKYVDHFEIMSYDYMGSWSNITGHHTALYSGGANMPANPSLSTNFNADTEVNYLLSQGIPSTKIKIGVALYARYWTNVTIPGTIDPSRPYFPTGNQTVPSGFPAETPGIIRYNTLMEKLNNNPTKWEIFHDPIAKADFAVNRSEGIFVTYDSKDNILEKANYVKSNNLAGVIVWDALGAKGTTILKELNAAIK
ncbi:glycoside hydrolase family 18 protein [Flavobacterium sp. LAR06]|uniref:glycoside hydrolase family 18 protein n=1 Tax=Flavobacterium sp. LAR06 TaxID=3064897 RepID=UPI0035C132C8